MVIGRYPWKTLNNMKKKDIDPKLDKEIAFLNKLHNEAEENFKKRKLKRRIAEERHYNIGQFVRQIFIKALSQFLNKLK